MAAWSKTVVCTRILLNHRADQIPACKLIEPVLCSGRVHACGVAKMIPLHWRYRGIVGHADTRITRGIEGVRIRSAEGPVVAHKLSGTCKHAVARPLVECGG